jgi:hypothetical protein
MPVSKKRIATVSRRKELISAAYNRPLSLDEQAELAFLWWSGSKASFVETLNQAYATAKRYQRFGGERLRNELDEFQRKLNCNDFKVLYRAKELFC